MLIYLVGQDRQPEEEEDGATALTVPLSGPPSDGGTPEEEQNPLGLELDPYWMDDVQERKACTFAR